MLKKIKIVSVLVGSRFPGDIGGDSDDGVVLLLEVAVDDLVDRGVGVLDGDGGDARVAGGLGLLDVIALGPELH